MENAGSAIRLSLFQDFGMTAVFCPFVNRYFGKYGMNSEKPAVKKVKKKGEFTESAIEGARFFFCSGSL